MLFNSASFLFFTITVFLIYWSIDTKQIKKQNLVLLIASYFFYACWDWRFLGLIFISSALDYYLGLKINATDSASRRKVFLCISLVTNLGLLAFFKYYNFFIESFSELLEMIGLQPHLATLNIILPVGISFYTFQTLSYTIDVYRKEVEVCKDFLAFLAFVSFFPQLVAGPIERAKNLLVQFTSQRSFNYDVAFSGIKIILWGLFKKTVMADNAGIYVDRIFSHYSTLGTVDLILGCLYFAIQIYCDFSGYSDMAIGLADLFGFKLMRNFNYPYFARTIPEFWKRWHISLSTWFKDYLYKPLGASSGTWFQAVRNVVIVFLLSGLWHGAKWNFVFWGLFHALVYCISVFVLKTKNFSGVFLKYFSFPLTIVSVMISWVFFRAVDLSQAIDYLFRIFKYSHISPRQLTFLPYLLVFLLLEWFSRNRNYPLQNTKNRIILYLFNLVLLLLIFNFGFSEKEFIYFQF